ncbi:MAG: TlpA family protein disulfide reductase, partial [Salibacteraceae bacterium]|nr:TlpA family protein disulfide reductase [Salibacteraceae bacterium]
YDYYLKVIQALDGTANGNEYYDALSSEVLAMRKLAPGSPAPEISLPQPNGEMLSLSDLKGQYVLIDFWASWCGPCRRENPNVKRVYEKYHDKGFEILGVSLDKAANAWTAAIAQDGLTWKHVSDLQYWNSSVVPEYQITGIPLTVLVDKEGNIIAKNLRGPALEEKLAEIFAK